MEKSGYKVVWPLGKRTTETASLAKRLGSLDGKTICELWEWMFRGDEMFPVIRKELSKRYSGIKFVGHEVFGRIHGEGEREVLAALPVKLKQNKCDAAITGVGC